MKEKNQKRFWRNERRTKEKIFATAIAAILVTSIFVGITFMAPIVRATNGTHPDPTFMTCDIDEDGATNISIGWSTDPTYVQNGSHSVHVNTSGLLTRDYAMVGIPTSFTLTGNTEISYWGYTVAGSDTNAPDEIYLEFEDKDVICNTHHEGTVGNWAEWNLSGSSNWYNKTYQAVNIADYYTETVVSVFLGAGSPTSDPPGKKTDVYLDNLTIDETDDGTPEYTLDDDTGTIAVLCGTLCGYTGCTSIQDGIDAALPGDTVNVSAGTYNESLLITKDITLQGSGTGSTTIISPGADAEYIIKVDGANVNVTDCIVNGSGYNVDYGIWYDNGATGLIKDNLIKKITNAGDIMVGKAIYVIDSDPNIQNNTIYDYGRAGIYIRGTGITSSMDVSENDITGQGSGQVNNRLNKGIGLYNGANATVHDNTITNCYKGTTCGPWGSPGIEICTSDILPNQVATSPTINHNFISFCQNGITVDDTKASGYGCAPQVTNNIISNITYAGIKFQTDYTGGTPIYTITGNTISNATTDRGIHVIAGSGPTVQYTIDDNVITNCKWGITADGGNSASTINNNTIDCNNIAGSLGIEPHTNANGVTILNNTISNCAFGGMEIRGSNIANDGNEIYGCNEGIKVVGDDNTIQNDNFHDNSYSGITVHSTANNTVIQGCTFNSEVRGVETWGTNTTITQNTFSSCTWSALQIGSLSSDTTFTQNNVSGCNLIVQNHGDNLVANYNNFDGTNTWGLENRDDTNIDAEFNWWGDASGPSDEGPGTGDKIHSYGTGGIDYSPWLGFTVGTSPMTFYTNDNIQDAIDAASAGDTVIVHPGTYVEYTGPISAGCAVDIPWFAEGAGGLTVRSIAGPATTIIDCGWAGWGVQIVSNDITFTGFTVKNAYSVINQVSAKGHNLSNLIITDFVNYGLGVAHGVECEFSNITIHTNNVSESEDRTVKGIDFIGYGSGGNNDCQFEDIIIYDIETTGTSGTSFGIYWSTSSTFPDWNNTFTNITIHDLTAENWMACGIYIKGKAPGTTPYAIENTTFSGGSIYNLGSDAAATRGFYVDGGCKNLNITGFNANITGGDKGIYFSHHSQEPCANVDIHYNNIVGNTEYGVQDYDGDNDVNATHNWWGSITGPYHPTANENGTGDNVSDNVDFIPWLGPNGGEIYEDQYQTNETAGNNQTEEFDAMDIADTMIEINTSAQTNISISNYTTAPGGDMPGGIGALGKYIDIEIENESAVIWPINITLYYTQADLDNAGMNENDLMGLYFWNETSDVWELYNETGVNTTDQSGYAGYVWANVWHLTPMQPGKGMTKNYSLQTGWNLVSIPVILDDTTCSAVLDSVKGDHDLVWAYDPVHGWRWYDPSGYSTLNDIDEKIGFWIWMDTAGNLNNTGKPPTTTDIGLSAGWNLIGYPSYTDKDPFTALFSIEDNYSLVWRYNLSYPSYWECYDPDTGLGFSEMEDGYGYWIWATKTSATLEVKGKW